MDAFIYTHEMIYGLSVLFRTGESVKVDWESNNLVGLVPRT
jgi:hypothetical protein